MEMSGSYRILAARGVVWAALNDPAVLKDCIPGCEMLEKLSDNQMQATVKAKIGPVKARFVGKVQLENVDPPEAYTISGEGSGAAGFAKGGADVRLTEDGNTTVLEYAAKARVGGKIAQLGARLIDGVAAKMAEEFFAAFAARLSATVPLPSPADGATTTDDTPAAEDVITAGPSEAPQAPAPVRISPTLTALDWSPRSVLLGMVIAVVLLAVGFTAGRL